MKARGSVRAPLSRVITAFLSYSPSILISSAEYGTREPRKILETRSVIGGAPAWIRLAL